MEQTTEHPVLLELCERKKSAEFDKKNLLHLRKALDQEIGKIKDKIQEYMMEHEMNMFIDPLTLQPYNVSTQLVCGKKPILQTKEI
ncbi:MAG: hypothetical protein EOO19_12280 [Chryseobacterium sp.]|nr:MAG: hypothetical protein EOO19_12280 [Chryseobacterium sp.]